MLGSNNIIQEQYYASHVLYFLIAAFKKNTKKQMKLITLYKTQYNQSIIISACN